MKIVVTGTRGIPSIIGGVETHCEGLYPLIAASGYDVTIIRRTNYIRDALKEYNGVRLINAGTPQKKSFEAIIHTAKAIWIARKHRADIVHIHSVGPALMTPIARMLGLKVVFTHHGPDYDREKWKKVAKFVLRMGERIGVKYANEVIVISEVINTIVKEKYHRSDAHLIYNGVPAPNFIQKTNYLEQLGLKPQKYIFAMGRFVPEKNFSRLIEAFSSLEHRDGYQLVLAGDDVFNGSYAHKIRKMAQEHRVVLTGFIQGEKLHELFTHASAFVLPSSHEGLPITLLEAMSYDLPVIVSDIPANLEVGLPSDCYFPTENEERLREELRKVIDQKPPKRKYPLEKYQWETIAKQTIKVYGKMR